MHNFCLCLCKREEVNFVVVAVMSALGAKLEMKDPSGTVCHGKQTHTAESTEERERERDAER